MERGKGEGRQGKINSILTIDSIDQGREAKKTRIENEREEDIMKWRRGAEKREAERERGVIIGQRQIGRTDRLGQLECYN